MDVTKYTFQLQTQNIEVTLAVVETVQCTLMHFGHIHSERTSVNSLHRLFAFMTYLNDVEDGGHTKYHHFDISIKPEIGKTIIWPAEWTHAHTGEVLKSGKKYIITGWLHFPVE